MERSLLHIFSAEQTDHIQHIRRLLKELPSEPNATSPVIEELLRRAHTLKGACRAVGLEQTEGLIHLAEDALLRLRQGQLPGQANTGRVLNHAMDAAEDILAAAIHERKAPDITEAVMQLNGLLGIAPVVAKAEPVREKIAETVSADANGSASSSLVRVNQDQLDGLIRASSQLLVAATSAVATDDLETYAARLDEVSREWETLRRRAASHSFLPDESGDRAVTECLNFMDRQLGALRIEAHAAAINHRNRNEGLHRQASDLYQNAYRVRTVAAEVVFGAFGPMVRDLARQEEKRVEFKSEGLDVQADRLVLQSFKDPVMHLLRNAVSHGIEPEAERVAAGKDAAGAIRLTITSRGDRMTITIEDDGRGINRDAVAEEARRRGMSPGESEALGSAEAAELILQPGFSTARMITTLSGRGMGLSSVRQAVSRFGGELNIRPLLLGGTSISISVPLSVSTQHILLVGVREHTFGIPSTLVERLVRFTISEILTIGGRSAIAVEGEPVTLTPLTQILNTGIAAVDINDSGDMLQAVILSANGEREAVLVDELIDEREMEIKETGLPAGSAGLTAGAIPLDDGSVAIVLNVTELYLRIAEWRSAQMTPLLLRKVEAQLARVLVADDSLTIRTVEKSILEANGYLVQLAVDGMDAWERIQQDPPDLVISDVMMPRMTGFQLLEKIKGSEKTKAISVILVTSLESREEQELGLTLGAEAYIVKRKFDQKELLQVVKQIL